MAARLNDRQDTVIRFLHGADHASMQAIHRHLGGSRAGAGSTLHSLMRRGLVKGKPGSSRFWQDSSYELTPTGKVVAATPRVPF
jgi:DNA-binding IclR family transcriptional regulator